MYIRVNDKARYILFTTVTCIYKFFLGLHGETSRYLRHVLEASYLYPPTLTSIEASERSTVPLEGDAFDHWK